MEIPTTIDEVIVMNFDLTSFPEYEQNEIVIDLIRKGYVAVPMYFIELIAERVRNQAVLVDWFFLAIPVLRVWLAKNFPSRAMDFYKHYYRFQEDIPLKSYLYANIGESLLIPKGYSRRFELPKPELIQKYGGSVVSAKVYQTFFRTSNRPAILYFRPDSRNFKIEPITYPNVMILFDAGFQIEESRLPGFVRQALGNQDFACADLLYSKVRDIKRFWSLLLFVEGMFLDLWTYFTIPREYLPLLALFDPFDVEDEIFLGRFELYLDRITDEMYRPILSAEIQEYLYPYSEVNMIISYTAFTSLVVPEVVRQLDTTIFNNFHTYGFEIINLPFAVPMAGADPFVAIILNGTGIVRKILPEDAEDFINLEPIGHFYLECSGRVTHYFNLETVRGYCNVNSTRCIDCPYDQSPLVRQIYENL